MQDYITKNKAPSELNTFWRCFIILKRNNFFYPISHNSRNDKIELILVLIFHLKCYGSAELFTCYCVYESLFYPLGLILFYYPYFYWCRERFHITNGVSCLVWIIFFCKSSEICFLDPELSSKWLLSKELIWHTEYMFKGWNIMKNKDTFIYNTFNWNITKSMISNFVHFR